MTDRMKERAELAIQLWDDIIAPSIQFVGNVSDPSTPGIMMGLEHHG